MSSFYNLINNTNCKPINNCATCRNTIRDGVIKNNVHYCENPRCVPHSLLSDDDDDDLLSDPFIYHRPPPPTRRPPPIPASNSPSPIDSLSSSSATSTPRTGGKCANCNNKYSYCIDSIDDGKNWFCGKSCKRVFNSGCNHIKAPPVLGLFASNLMTVYPVRSGFTSSGYKMEY
jgi:hypothetical protein